MARTGRSTRAALAIGLLASLGLVAPAVTSPAGASPRPSFCFTAASYGTRAFVGTVVRSDPSAPSQIGCTKGAPITRSNSTTHVGAARMVTSGTLFTTARTTARPTRAASSSTVQHVNLLGGAITASVVESASATSWAAGHFSLSGAGSRLLGLRVLGRPITLGARTDYRVALPGLGFVIFNQQVPRRTSTAASLIIDAIHVVVVDQNGLGIAPGTNVLVAHAMSGLQGPVVGLLGGDAYGTSLNVGRLVRSGPTWENFMPCLGSRGVVYARGGAGISRPDLISSATDRNTVEGVVGPSRASGSLTSTVQSATLLGGLVHATVIRAAAHLTDVGGAVHVSDAGSSFATLSVAGLPAINASVPANTALAIPGLGILYLHRVIVTARSIEVRMIELVVTQANSRGLAIGTDLRVAVATVSVR